MVTPPPPLPFPPNLKIYVGDGGGRHVVSIYVAIIPQNCSNEKFNCQKCRFEQLSGRPPVSRAGGRAFESRVVCYEALVVGSP